MVSKTFSRFLAFTSRLVFKQLRIISYKFLARKSSNFPQSSFTKYHMISSVTDLESESLKNTAVVIDLEGALLKNSDLFPYFMLVAFEAGSVIRSLVLLALYPFLYPIRSNEVRIKAMIMVCFFGLKENSFRIGTSVLPKFFSEETWPEVFQIMMKNRALKKIGVSKMPRIMLETFLKDYMGFDHVVGTELKTFCGYFMGLIDDPNIMDLSADLDTMIGVCNPKSSISNKLVPICNEVYFTTDLNHQRQCSEVANKYAKQVVFHDGRLAFRPTWVATIAMYTWFPFGICLAFLRSVIGLFLPYTVSRPVLAFSGLRLRVKKQNTAAKLSAKSKHILYVCNHRTLLDPLYLCFILNKNLTAVTYSLSRISEHLSPIKTVRLVRDSNTDSNLMKQILNEDDMVVCPEGTTCREPYLLRFSPLFTEINDIIVPVAIDTKVTMFHGTTATGLKCLDPFFYLMNPCPLYIVKFLDPVVRELGSDCRELRRFEVANMVQSEIAKALNFTCTMFTRRDKYMILAGNEGRVSTADMLE